MTILRQLTLSREPVRTRYEKVENRWIDGRTDRLKRLMGFLWTDRIKRARVPV